MALCYPLTLIPMTRIVTDGVRDKVETDTSMWFVFPEEVQEKMIDILKPYGYEQDSDKGPDAEHFLGTIEFIFEPGHYPWAIIFLSAEYPLGGHLLSIRPNRDIRYSNYSRCHPHNDEPFEIAIDGQPPVSFINVFSKAALRDAAATSSLLLMDAWSVLSDKPESGNWVVIADPLDPAWVQATAKEAMNCPTNFQAQTQSVT